jgi:hypothetical protein
VRRLPTALCHARLPAPHQPVPSDWTMASPAAHPQDQRVPACCHRDASRWILRPSHRSRDCRGTGSSHHRHNRPHGCAATLKHTAKKACTDTGARCPWNAPWSLTPGTWSPAP